MGTLLRSGALSHVVPSRSAKHLETKQTEPLRIEGRYLFRDVGFGLLCLRCDQSVVKGESPSPAIIVLHRLVLCCSGNKVVVGERLGHASDCWILDTCPRGASLKRVAKLHINTASQRHEIAQGHIPADGRCVRSAIYDPDRAEHGDAHKERPAKECQQASVHDPDSLLCCLPTRATAGNHDTIRSIFQAPSAATLFQAKIATDITVAYPDFRLTPSAPPCTILPL